MFHLCDRYRRNTTQLNFDSRRILAIVLPERPVGINTWNSHMVYDTKYDLAYRLISDILSKQEILLSINSGSGSIAEARIEKGLPFRIECKWQ
jgi:hypothetical protein